jgi:hypothetical protein
MECMVTLGQLTDAAGTTHKTIWEGRYHGELPPAKPSNGTRGTTRYSMCQVLAIRVARILDKRFSVQPADMRDLISRLWNFTTAELLDELEAGQTCTVLVNRRPSLVLFPASVVVDIDAYLRSKNVTAEIVAFSIEHEWKRVMESITPAEMTPAQ